MLAAPADVVHAFAAAWAARDGAALAGLFAQDADFVNVVGLWWHDRAAIEAAHTYGLTRIFAHSHLRAGRISTRMLGADHAIVHVRWHLTGQSAPDGTPAAPRQSVMSFVMARAQAGWHAVAAQNTDVVAGAETLLNDGERLVPQDYRRA